MGKSDHCGHKDCAISITSIAVIGICCCCTQLWTSVSALATENDIYDDVAKSFDGQLIRVTPDFQTVIDKVFERIHYCGDSTDSDHRRCRPSQCLKADDAFRFVGYLPGTEVLTPKTFLAVSVPVIVYMLDIRLYCEGSSNYSNSCISSEKTSVKEKMDCWIRLLLRNRTSLSESDLNNMFSRLSEIYSAAANYNMSKGVVNASVMLKTDLRIRYGRGLTRDKVPLFSAVFVSRLFHGAPIIAQEIVPNTPRTIPTVPVYTIGIGQTKSNISVPEVYATVFAESIFDIDSQSRLSVERLVDIMHHLKIGNLTSWNPERPNRDAEQHNLKKDRRKRQVNLPMKSVNESCWSVNELLDTFDIQQSTLSKSEFERICPALIQQTYSGVCARPIDARENSAEREVGSRISDAEKYGYGTASVVIISLVSVVGIVFIPLLRKKIYFYTLQGFIALGVGTLCGDALLHLLPEALNVRDTNHHDPSAGSKPDLDIPDGNLTIWRGVACLGAIYLFFLWEICLHYFISYKKRHRKADAKGQEPDVQDTHAHHDHSHIPDPSTFTKAKNQSHAHGVAQLELRESKTPSGEINAKNDQHAHPTENHETFLGLAPLAWMILLGDAIHNFGDGLTIAAAFSVDVRSGISTSIAIFCHEIPHELGDFAILLNTGMSFRRAMALNFISALTCLVGFYIGVPIASYDSARQWIFTIAAGMFLYVALADMLPELKHGATNILMLVTQNLGLIVGAGIMILMALYEESIQI